MRSLVALVLTITVFVTNAVAQSGDWAAVEGLKSEADISVQTLSGETYQGNFDSATPELLVLWSQERDFPSRKLVRREIPRQQVKKVRIVHRVGSVVAGSAIGAGIGASIGVIADSQMRNHEDRGLVAFVLGALGAGLGAAISKARPFIKGRVIYIVP